MEVLLYDKRKALVKRYVAGIMANVVIYINQELGGIIFSMLITTSRPPLACWSTHCRSVAFNAITESETTCIT